ncbi:MAG: 2-hydroxy-3-oxopropionate reductase [Lacrimispora celerecrescens]|uniref:2-hydroxy-3-oxopropionate reductase n=1 Tax=Lacrimispora indolis TaxID=69825 RepID=UPI000420EB45|nr:2-hydroxy-3-oxopropionate reductase [[Clostridium] methoxybenzovorans]MBE7722547.1 2-hydroxy-3-oxopropionate reductase [Lacrimispora celerecrescens]
MKVGFIGLGIMGRPMAKNLLKAGYELNICDVNEEAVKEVEAAGGAPYKTPKEVAEKSEIILTMLPNSPHVRTVMKGKDGVLEGIKPGTIVVDMSSIDPTVSIELEKAVSEAGGEMIDAPVSGGEPKAIDGTLSFMCGSKEEVFDQVKPILEKMGASVVHTGEIGSGNMTKLANQMIVAVNIAAMSEALVLAAKSGVNPERVYQAIRGGLAGSTVMDAKAPMMLDRNFKPGFRIELHIKDLNNAKHASEAVDMDLPMTKQVLEMMNKLQEQGLGAYDHSAVLWYYEEKENVEVKR